MKVFVDLTTWVGYVGFLALMVFLVFFCLRTRSKGLIVLATALMGVRILSWLVLVVYNTYMWPVEAGDGYKGRELASQLKARHRDGWYRSRVILQFMSTRCVSGIQRVAKGKVQQRGREMKGVHTMPKYRSAIIGCGSRAYGHANAYQQVSRGELVACANRSDSARREKFAETFNITGYANAEEMLRKEKT